jgi:hypothetical protein
MPQRNVIIYEYDSRPDAEPRELRLRLGDLTARELRAQILEDLAGEKRFWATFAVKTTDPERTMDSGVYGAAAATFADLLWIIADFSTYLDETDAEESELGDLLDCAPGLKRSAIEKGVFG